ncbi:MAG: hypothetical protein Q7U14_03265, partial [Lacisediminimonas sp.]|nr:hypothetical protein [Lacisediminimonas sp.]
MVKKLAKIRQEAVAGSDTRVDGAEEDFAIGRVLRVMLAASEDAMVADDGGTFNQARATNRHRVDR